MKKIFLLSIIAFAFSCERQEDNSQKDLLVGNWAWISSSGGINGTTETPNSTGKTVRLNISKDSIKIYENGSLTFKNSYFFSTDKSILDNKVKEMIVYKSGLKTSYHIENNNKLFLNDECFDCLQSSYQKIEN